MKIRSGFVSNSSSSSFIANCDTVIDTAIEMLPARGWHEIDFAMNDDALMNIFEKLKNIPDYNDDTAITFKSCNYDTYIMKHAGLIFVETCNNHPWYDAIDYRRATDGELKLIDEYDNYEFTIHDQCEYYLPEYDIIGSRSRGWDHWCRTCHSDIFTVDDKEICPKCKTEFKKENKDG